jgi:PKD domain
LIIVSTGGLVPGVNAADSNLLYINPPQQGSVTTGAIVIYEVKVANMDPFNSWDIQVQTNPAVLNPVSIDTSLNALTANYSITIVPLTSCIDGFGTGCDPTRGDGPGVVHSAVAPFGAAPKTTSITGVLFTITYNVVNGTGLSSILLYNDQLANSDVLVAHSTQNGIYGNALLPHVNFYWTPTEPVVGQTVSFFSNASDANPGAAITEYSWSLGCNTQACVKTGSNITFVYGTTWDTFGGGEPVNGTIGAPIRFLVQLTVTDSLGIANTAMHALLVQTLVPAPGFNIDLFGPKPSPGAGTLSAGSSEGFAGDVVSFNGFQGEVNLSSSIYPEVRDGPVAVFAPNPVVLAADASTSFTLTVSTLATTPGGSYNATVIGSSGSKISSSSFFLVVAPFSLGTEPSVLVVEDGQSGRSMVNVTSINGFSGTLMLEAKADCVGCTASLTRDKVTLIPNGSEISILTISVPQYVGAFRYGAWVEAFVPSQLTPSVYLYKTLQVQVPLLEPIFVREGLSWNHLVALSSGPTQVWTAAVANPNGGDYVYVDIHMTGSSQGGTAFTADSGPILLTAGEMKLNITISDTFTASDIGSTFLFKATIQWGIFSASRLNMTSSSTQVGSFMVVA